MAGAVALARAHGVEIPDDIMFVPATLSGDRDAEYGAFRPEQDVRWADFYTDTDEPMIPVRISRDVLQSDEAIVAVLAHEMHELNALRAMFEDCGTMTGRALDLHICRNRRGNLHWHAWEEADKKVISMIETAKQKTKKEGAST